MECKKICSAEVCGIDGKNVASMNAVDQRIIQDVCAVLDLQNIEQLVLKLAEVLARKRQDACSLSSLKRLPIKPFAV